jgi:hypothetical protein
LAWLYFHADGTRFKALTSSTIPYWMREDWVFIPGAEYSSAKPLENGETTITFSLMQTSRLRAVATNPQSAAIVLVEMKASSPRLSHPAPNDHKPAHHDLDSRDESGTPRITFEIFCERGRFGITVATERETFDTGCYVTFEAAQEALQRLVDDIIERQAKKGWRIGVHCVILADAPAG